MKEPSSPAVEISDFLGRLPLFADVGEPRLKFLAGACRFRRVSKGEAVFLQSDPSEAAYVVRTGRVSILLHSADGREMVIEEMRPGDLFGELGVLTKGPRSASAVTQSNGELLVVPRAAFLRCMEDEPRLVRQVLELTASRLQLSVNREIALAFMNAQGRLARHLLSLAEREREKGYVTVSQEDLARATGLIRQTVAKVLGTWRRDGWLLTGRGRILILNRKALEAVEKGSINLGVVSPK